MGRLPGMLPRITIGVHVGVADGVPNTVGVAVAVGVALGQGGVVSSSTVLTVVLAVLKPSATSPRPSGRVPCACPARLPTIAGRGRYVPLLLAKRRVAVVALPLAPARSVMRSGSRRQREGA